MDMDGYRWVWMDMDGYGWIWMDMDGRTDGRTDGRMDGWMDGFLTRARPPNLLFVGTTVNKHACVWFKH